jgi:hypothetical protein
LRALPVRRLLLRDPPLLRAPAPFRDPLLRAPDVRRPVLLRPVLRPDVLRDDDLRLPAREAALRAPPFLAPRFAMSGVAPCASPARTRAHRSKFIAAMYDRGAHEPAVAQTTWRGAASETNTEAPAIAPPRHDARW